MTPEEIKAYKEKHDEGTYIESNDDSINLLAPTKKPEEKVAKKKDDWWTLTWTSSEKTCGDKKD